MNPTPNLNPLLEALGQAGFPSGVAERMRLHQVFRLAPQWGGDAAARLKSVLRAVLLKDARQADRFDRLCDQWLAGWSFDAQSLPPPLPKPPPKPEPPPSKTRARLGLCVVLLLLFALFPGNYQQTIDNPPVAPPPRIIDPPPPPELTSPAPQTLDDLRKANFTSRKPQLTVVNADRHFAAWRELSLGLFALSACGLLWRKTKRRRWLPDQEPPPVRLGPPRVFLQSEVKGLVMLNPDDQQALVWGIDHYAALDQTRRLDVPATVKATAHAAGIPTVVRQRARHQREVWLWLDEAAEEAGLSRLAQEMAVLLPKHGLHLEQAGFWGLPDRLQGPDGRSFAPREIEERRATARVAILTDGRHLARLWRADDQRNRINGLLRQLSHWPALWFVDSSQGSSGLARILAPHGIPCITAAQLPNCLAGAADRNRRNAKADEEIWAAAMALAPSAVDEGLAWRIRKALSLHVEPCALDRLRNEAPGPAGRLLWRRAMRADWVNWLSAMETATATGGKTVLDRVLDFWLEAYREEARNRAESGADTWQDSPAERHLRMEQALVGLWRNPTESIPELYRLYRGSLADSIKQQMEALAPKDRHLGKADQIRLPWLWSDRSGPEKQMLFAMNFAEASTGKVELRQPGRLWLGFGLGIAMGLAALLFTLAKPWEMPAGKPVLQHDAFKPEAQAEFFQPLGGGRWRVSVATPDWRVETEAPVGATVTAAWPEATHPCRENGSGGELWHGACAHPAHRQPEPIVHSFAALDAAADVAAPLVLSLLQSGSADLVLTAPANPPGLQDNWLSYVDVDPEHTQLLMIGPNLTVNAIESAAEVGRNRPVLSEAERPAPAGVSGKLADRMPETVAKRPYFGLPPNLNSTALNPSLPHRVWLQASDWQSLANALNFTGERSVAQVWPKAAVIAGDAKQTRLLGNCQPQAYTDANGMKFVRLCAGRFLMGSPDNEKDRNKDESPQHWVSLSAFALGQTEVTNAQYQKFKPDHPDKDDRPVAKVNWNEAKAFCEHYGYRLPTEAEWEYAVRAGSKGRWPFGEDETQLDSYAWYRQNADDKTHTVGQKQANPWGLYDMAGNVWEWVADWYGPYSADPQTNPTGPAAGDYRVLRGGAFGDEPRGLRSAFRYRVNPEDGSRVDGFRCARGPRRQP
jgi:formylglycine-generating enzyme required for sulfatase activity